MKLEVWTKINEYIIDGKVYQILKIQLRFFGDPMRYSPF